MSEQQKCPQCGTALPSGALEGLCPACLLKQGTATESGSQGGQAPFQPLSVPEVARLFPQLEILELVGRGGMGAIYKARQPSLDRFVALKILPSRTSGGASFAERFNREARALARLSHPNIITVHEFGQVDGWHYFLMEYVDGVNLRQLQQAGRLSPRDGLAIVPQICDALQYAHDEGIVHRDIKPENILVDRKGRVKIADFGLAKILGTDSEALRLTGEGHVMGTPHYMAPEQVEHPLEVDHRADIYALGVVFYEMLTGELPLGRFAPPSRKVQLDVRLDDVVLRALEKEPERRYQQASQVKTAVEIITSEPAHGKPAAPETALRQPANHWRRMGGPRRLAVLSGLIVLVVIAVGTVTFSLPRTYSSTARIIIEPAPHAHDVAGFDPFFIQTEMEKMRSRELTRRVAERLGLKKAWAGRYGVESLSTGYAAARLHQSLDLRQTRDTSLIEIRYYSEDPREAAEIANAFAEEYRAFSPNSVSIVDPAEPGLRPVRPNVPLNLALGVVAGALLGLLAAGILFTASLVRAALRQR